MARSTRPAKPKKTAAKPPRPRGAPSAYRQEFAEQARKLCLLLGATNAQLAEFFGVTERTIENWTAKIPEFAQALRQGKTLADAEVAASLYHRAIGYSHKAVKIMQHEGKSFVHEFTEHYPPDTLACKKWLHNRQPQLWREGMALTGGDGGPIQTENLSDLELARRLVFLLEAGGREAEEE